MNRRKMVKALTAIMAARLVQASAVQETNEALKGAVPIATTKDLEFYKYLDHFAIALRNPRPLTRDRFKDFLTRANISRKQVARVYTPEYDARQEPEVGMPYLEEDWTMTVHMDRSTGTEILSWEFDPELRREIFTEGVPQVSGISSQTREVCDLPIYFHLPAPHYKDKLEVRIFPKTHSEFGQGRDFFINGT